jgi:hypothetical protein
MTFSMTPSCTPCWPDGLKLDEVRRFLDEMKRRLQLTHRKAA